ITRLAVSPDGKRIAASGDGGIQIWSAENQKTPEKTFPLPGGEQVVTLLWASEHVLLTGGSGKLVARIDVESEETLGQPLPEHVISVGWDARKKNALVLTHGGKVQSRDSKELEPLSSVQFRDATFISEVHGGPTRFVDGGAAFWYQNRLHDTE